MFERRQLLLGFAATMMPGSQTFEAMAQSADAGAEAVGTVANLQGSAIARRSSNQRNLNSGQQVFVNERLQTAASSRLHARLGPATQLFMGENTRVTIDNHLVRRGGTIHLGEGAVMFERKDPDPKPNVTIQSPYAQLAVRGTTVFAGPSNGVFGVFVVLGEVHVSNAGGSVTLRTGEGTNIATPGAKPTSAAIWGDARIIDAMRAVR